MFGGGRGRCVLFSNFGFCSVLGLVCLFFLPRVFVFGLLFLLGEGGIFYVHNVMLFCLFS